MKKILILFSFFLLSYQFGYSQNIHSHTDSIAILKDSIVKLNKRPIMTNDQFIKLYKYEQLYKFYLICKRKPSQWKYYAGWSRRTFENK
jgi:hypothetical protein